MIPWLVVILGVVLLVARQAMGQQKKNGASLGLSPMQVLVYSTAVDADVDPAMVLAIVEKESGFDPLAVNKSDPSYGLGQVMAFWVPYFEMGTLEEAPDKLLDAEFNARVTVLVLKYFFEQKGFNWPTEADVYNVGEPKWGRGIRNERYRRDVTQNYHRWRERL